MDKQAKNTICLWYDGDAEDAAGQHVEAAEVLDQRMRDRAAAAQMAEAHRVVAVDQDAAVQTPLRHVPPPCFPGDPLLVHARSVAPESGAFYTLLLLPSDG